MYLDTVYKEHYMEKTKEPFFVIKALSPSHEYIQTLSLRASSQLPYIIAGDIVCSFAFVLLGIGLLVLKVTVMAVLCLLPVIFCAVSLSQIKKDRLNTGASLTTAGLLSACFLILFFAPVYDTSLITYRNAFFIVVMAILNQIVSVNLRQISVFTAVSAAMWAADWFTVFQPLMTTHADQMKGTAVITNFAVIISYVTIFLINKFNGRIIDKAEQKERDSVEALEKIRSVFEESKTGLNVGKRLSDSALTATGSVSRIQELSRYLIDESSQLSIEASTVNKSGSQITDQALKMKDSVHEQASSITETSAAMTEISANIANISKIASAQHKGMDEIIRSLDSQRTLLAELVNQVGQVKSSSDGIAAFVSTIDSISSQTSLLAMNASIEAAHAGNFGKGFSVIAQEIRKLSEETTKSAAKISDTLKLNGEIVKSTSASVASFASYTEKSANELRTTIQAIEEILSGISEMNTGTQDIMKALQNIVDESQNNAGLVEDVVSEISQQKTALEHISGFAETLRERTGGLDEALSGIETAISIIQKDAAENSAVGEKISASVSQQ